MDAVGAPSPMHDDTVDRTTNGTGTVTQMTAAALRALDAGAKRNPAGLATPPFAGAPVPFVTEYCALGAQTGLPLMPEIKNYRSPADIGLMIAVAQAAGVAAQCEWQSFQQSDLVAARSYDPTCALCLTWTASRDRRSAPMPHWVAGSPSTSNIPGSRPIPRSSQRPGATASRPMR